MNIPRAIAIQTTDVHACLVIFSIFSNRKGELTIVLEFNSHFIDVLTQKNQKPVFWAKEDETKVDPKERRDHHPRNWKLGAILIDLIL